jgi:hypothetical protein
MTWYGWCQSDGSLPDACAAAHATSKLTGNTVLVMLM